MINPDNLHLSFVTNPPSELTSLMNIIHSYDNLNNPNNISGKDMTFRDFAQGAFRMRGIGSGQRIHLLITPEVKKLMDDNITHCGPQFHLGGKINKTENEKNLDEVVGWLLLNGMYVYIYI